jgi:hypothetical protein
VADTGRGDDMGSLELAEASGEVLEPNQRTLAKLVSRVETEHLACKLALNTALTHAVAAGEALLELRILIPRGEWGQWIDANLDLTRGTVATYCRLATYSDQLPLGVGIKEAQRALIGRPWTRTAGMRERIPQDVLDEAVRLYTEDGLTRREAAELMGISETSIQKALDPEKHRRSVRASIQRRRKLEEAMAAQERERAIKQAVRKAGAAEQELYAMAERMQDVMGQAHREATDREKREHYALAGEHYRKMRDEIVRALGIK